MSKEDYLTEGMLRTAIEETSSVRRACQYLGTTVKTFKKYAQKHHMVHNGDIVDYYEFMLIKSKANEHKRNRDIARNHNKVMEGTAKPVTIPTLERRLIEYNTLPMCCSSCGYDFVRPDGKMPLKVDFIDGNRQNQIVSNLRWLCFNCYFIEKREE